MTQIKHCLHGASEGEECQFDAAALKHTRMRTHTACMGLAAHTPLLLVEHYEGMALQALRRPLEGP